MNIRDNEIVKVCSQARYADLVRQGADIITEPRYSTVLQAVTNGFSVVNPNVCLSRYCMMKARIGVMQNSAAGWNAESLADGTIILNYDLVNASYTVARAFVKSSSDRSFSLEKCFCEIANRLVNDIMLMPLIELPPSLEMRVTSVFGGMVGFVFAHEFVHFINQHVLKSLDSISRFELEKTITNSPEMVANWIAKMRIGRLLRMQEDEADAFGVGLLVNSSASAMPWVDCRGALLSLSFMVSLERQFNCHPSTFDSHPPSTERMASVIKLMRQARIAIDPWN